MMSINISFIFCNPISIKLTVKQFSQTYIVNILSSKIHQIIGNIGFLRLESGKFRVVGIPGRHKYSIIC